MDTLFTHNKPQGNTFNKFGKLELAILISHTFGFVILNTLTFNQSTLGLRMPQ